MAFVHRCAGQGCLELLHEVLVIEQTGEQILLAELLQFLFQLFVVTFLVNHDLGAGLAIHTGRRELHGGLEFVATGMHDVEFQCALRCFTIAQGAQDVLEFLLLVGGDHIHNRHGFQLVAVDITKNVQITLVDVDMHAFV